jgi:hypothetical protein
MKEKDEWVFFRDIDWDYPDNNRFNIDTRDFHCGYLFDSKPHDDYAKLSTKAEFFHTKEELVSLIERLYVESGGEGEWRMLDLVVNDDRLTNWNLKYLRIYRTDRGFVVCNSKQKSLNKTLLDNPVDQRYLNHH